jgi:hypothetical protein
MANAGDDGNNDLKLLATQREDILGRFFAVAVSVGFASQIKDAFGSILSRGVTTPGQCTHAFLLIFAMVVVLGSWEFYFRAIGRSPLYDTSRFVIDISIVSLYVMLMVESSDPRVFVIVLMAIMGLYVVWDILRVWNTPERFGVSTGTSPLEVAMVYARPLQKSTDESRSQYGPAITLWWFIVMATVSTEYMIGPKHSVLQLPILLLCYVVYRIDQAQHHKLGRRLLEAFLVLGLLALSMVFKPIAVI